jgi:hypothetical protein
MTLRSQSCGHSWKPIPTWGGRYRCEWCGALAFRKLVDRVHPGKNSLNDRLQVYRCRKCDEPAVVYDKLDGGRCRVHAESVA